MDRNNTRTATAVPTSMTSEEREFFQAMGERIAEVGGQMNERLELIDIDHRRRAFLSGHAHASQGRLPEL